MLTVKKIIKNKLWVSSTVAIVVALIIIPIGLLFVNTEDVQKFDNEYYKISRIKTPKGIYIKSADPVFYDFINDVKKTNGIILLGTSETSNWLAGKNYYTLLSKDKDFDKTVYPLAGAGRLANMYFPLILNNSEAFDGLEMIYYINPTYWRTDLCNFNDEYFERYVDFSIVQKIKHLEKEKGVYNDFLRLSLPNYISAFSNKLVEDYKGLFVNKLTRILGTNEIDDKEVIVVEKQKASSKDKIDIGNYYTPEELEAERNKINFEYNATDKYLTKNVKSPEIDNSSTYQYDLLKAFILLCKDYNINCTFYLGPYNEIYCMAKNPEFIDEHRQTIKNIRQLLIENEVDFIDGTSLSNVQGTFMDIQHISEYGAYLTALQIKEYYEKKD
jgi:hypothetical protein